MHRILIAITFAFIVVRGYLYFSNQQAVAAILDLAALPIYLFACIKERRHIYVSIVAYLPGSSVFYLSTGLIPFDLSLIIVLLSTTLLTREMTERKYFSPVNFAILLYAGLCAYLFTNMVLESMLHFAELREQIKVLYFLLTATVAAYLFGKVYHPEDNEYFRDALALCIVAYVVAGCVGYLFPLATDTWQTETDFKYKSLFRYPGMSSSNYIAHVLLVVLAMHKFLGKSSAKPLPISYYLIIVGIIAVVSQSRSFAVAAIVLIFLWVVFDALNVGRLAYIRTARGARLRAGVGISLFALVSIVLFHDFFLILADQTLNRLTFQDYSVVNVGYRLREWHDTFEHFHESGRSALIGNLSYPEGLRPHNVVLGAVLVFGVPVAFVVFVLICLLILSFPVLLFVFVGAQAEILFVTGVYDFLFLAFIFVLCADNRHPKGSLIFRASRKPGQGQISLRP